MNDQAETLGLHDLFHVGIVVHDLDESMRRYEALGSGSWTTFDAETPALYRGRETIVAARIAFARSGPIHLELVQPTKGEFTGSVFLAERGEGAYHLGYWVDDLDETMARAVALGHTIDVVSEQGGFAYLGADSTSGLHMELVSTRNRPALQGVLS